MIEAEILRGHCNETKVPLSCIHLKTAEDVRLPFAMVRKQFLVKLCFPLTINKSEGQAVPHVGIFLPPYDFSHGQLHVVLSKGTSQ